MKEEILKQLRVITEEEREILNGRKDVNTEIYNLNRSMTVDCERLLERGHLIDLRPHTRFIHFPKHTHNYVELVYMCSGQTRHIVNGTEVTLNEGELLFMSQNAEQEIYPAGKEDLAVNFIILPEFFHQLLDMIGTESSLIRDFLVECLRNDRQDISFLHFQVVDVLPIQNLMENLIWMLLTRQPNRRRLYSTTMGLVFLHLMNSTEKMDIGKDHYEQNIALQVFRFIDENYCKGELSDLAKENGYDLYQLSRLIKNVTGRTYTQLLQEKRLKQAAFLLENTRLSITDVSLDVGYSNFSYFYKIFREKYGMSPKQFRRKTVTI